MQKIELSNVLPRVFAGRADSESGVWLVPRIEFIRGDNYLISAESGGGKSSLCAYLFGYRTDYTGEILFDGDDIRNLPVAKWCCIRRESIAYLPQELRLFPELTALENVELKNRLTRYKTKQEITDMFERLGIGDKLHSAAAKLSIGQQQRVAVIRTLCQPCDFFLLDEPVSHLDAANNATIAALITEEAAKSGAGIIATSVGNNLNIKVGKELKL